MQLAQTTQLPHLLQMERVSISQDGSREPARVKCTASKWKGKDYIQLPTDIMKVFITGCTGFIGSRVLEQLLAGKHDISALVRSEAGAQTLKAKGVKPVLGDLTSLDVAAAAAKEADVVLHLAFIHDFSKYMESIARDLAFIKTLLAALAGASPILMREWNGPLFRSEGKCLEYACDDAHQLFTGRRKACMTVHLTHC